MADLTAADRKRIPKADFAVPSKAPGSGSFPIPDKDHARNALARASGKPVQGQVDAAVHRKFPSVGSPAASKGSGSAGGATTRSSGSGTSGMDRAMSAHADRAHPTKGGGPSVTKAGY